MMYIRGQSRRTSALCFGKIPLKAQIIFIKPIIYIVNYAILMYNLFTGNL